MPLNTHKLIIHPLCCWYLTFTCLVCMCCLLIFELCMSCLCTWLYMSSWHNHIQQTFYHLLRAFSVVWSILSRVISWINASFHISLPTVSIQVSLVLPSYQAFQHIQTPQLLCHLQPKLNINEPWIWNLILNWHNPEASLHVFMLTTIFHTFTPYHKIFS